jgi:hypothetical protein
MFMKFLFAIVASFLLVGNAFAEDAPVSPETWSTYQGATLTTVTHKPADFLAMTSGRAMFGMIGAFTMIGAGNNLVTADQLVDPALAIAARLSTDLASRTKSASVTSLADQDSDSEEALAHAAGGKGLVLDVETTGWGYTYYSLDWGHYRTAYSARVRLLDAATGKFIAKTKCIIDPDKDATSPTGDEMLANKGERLKAMLAADGDQCLASVEKDFFGATELTPAAPAVPPPAATTAATPPVPAAPASGATSAPIPPKTN